MGIETQQRDNAQRTSWRTVSGDLDVAELERACAAMSIGLSRARRTYWQAAGLFPLPEVRRVSRPGGVRGYYHRAAPLLALLVDSLLAREASARAGGGRWSPTALARQLEEWRRFSLSIDVDPAAQEGNFYQTVRFALAALHAGRAISQRPEQNGHVDLDPSDTPSDAIGRNSASPVRSPSRDHPRWPTLAGSLTAAELDQACQAIGVYVDRSRRTYWQAQRVFPQPEIRWLSRPGHQGGARGYYHEGAPFVAMLVDYALRADHPAKRGRWRCSTPALAALLAGWRADAADSWPDPGQAEQAFYARVRQEARRVQDGWPIEGIEPQHTDVLPTDQRRVPPDEVDAARRGTAAAVLAIADAWLAAHAGESTPDRLVVWFRLERHGPKDWRIVDARARRTSHDAQRLRLDPDAPTASPGVALLSETSSRR